MLIQGRRAQFLIEPNLQAILSENVDAQLVVATRTSR
jgi:hypothetical protein